MSKENDYPDLDDEWEEAEDTEETADEPLLDSIAGHKDARRRLDDLMEERRLRREMGDDF
ncbi:MAG: PA3496 family putative envelope integrity protein [Pseudomonadota bacterium]